MKDICWQRHIHILLLLWRRLLTEVLLVLSEPLLRKTRMDCRGKREGFLGSIMQAMYGESVRVCAYIIDPRAIHPAEKTGLIILTAANVAISLPRCHR